VRYSDRDAQLPGECLRLELSQEFFMGDRIVLSHQHKMCG
jgi:hypothetical protein